MPHPVVTQLRFTRSEFRRAIYGVTDEEAARRFSSINPIAWITGHLSWHEQVLWLERAQGKVVAPEVKPCGFGQPPCDPSFDEMRAAWQRITAATDPYLDGLTSETMEELFEGARLRESIGTSLRRLTYHYWFHIGESQAIRQLLGHKDLPTFVGNIGEEAPYVPEPRA
ncbi:MAG TPA: DinB family protein [Gemmatimonadaceae bacterium]